MSQKKSVQQELRTEEIRKAFQRLWIYGKQEEVTKFLHLAQLELTAEELDQWVKSKDISKAVESDGESEDSIQDDAELPQSVSVESSDPSQDLSQDAITTLAYQLGLRYNTPGGRYVIGNEIARGGVGRVMSSHDRQLLRPIVVKTLNRGTTASRRVMLNFIREAQITAQLEHPNIVPLHDIGVLPNGEVYYTMKLIEGQTLKQITQKIRRKDEATRRAFPRFKLLRIFRQICHAVAFAHSRGVLHRDLKPSNVMVGAFDEVLVLDWGVAKTFKGSVVHKPIKVHHSEGVGRSTVVGTPAYMPPEQANGKVNKLDQRSDVYSLGAILYELLTYRPPFRGSDPQQILNDVITKKPIPPREFKPTFNIPKFMETMCMKCLSRSRSKRYQSVGALIDDLDRFTMQIEDLDRRITLADERYKEGEVLLDKFQKARSELAELNANLEALRWNISPYPSRAHRIEIQELTLNVEDQTRSLARLFSQAERELLRALAFYDDHGEARRDLALLYSLRLEEAEDDREFEEIKRLRSLLEEVDDGTHQELLIPRCRVDIQCQPMSAKVTLARQVDIDGLMGSLSEVELGNTPLNLPSAEEGKWMVKLSADGYKDALFPIEFRRGSMYELTAQLRTDREIGGGFIQIPGGAALLGGDPSCSEVHRLNLVNIPEFAISRTPVTCAEYLAFLNDLHQMNPEEAQGRVPRLRDGTPLWRINEKQKYRLPVTEGRIKWSPRWPVFSVSFQDAVRFCWWYSQRTGLKVRLPREEEWEKAGRGAQARIYPWGDTYNSSFCHIARGRLGQRMPVPVESIENDRSPYGVQDLAGNVQEYCDSPFSENSSLRVLKGGGFDTVNISECRMSYREGIDGRQVKYQAGFRLARDI